MARPCFSPTLDASILNLIADISECTPNTSRNPTGECFPPVVQQQLQKCIESAVRSRTKAISLTVTVRFQIICGPNKAAITCVAGDGSSPIELADIEVCEFEPTLDTDDAIEYFR